MFRISRYRYLCSGFHALTRSRENGYLAILSLLLLCITQISTVQAKEVTHSFNGLTLNANLEMAEGKDFGDGMVLILHGYLAHNKMEIIETAQQALLDNEQNSLAINLSLGIDNRHGFYDCNRPHRHTQENAVLEIDAWIDWLQQRGVNRVVLMGHSRGANQIMVYAVDRLDPMVTHLVFLAPGAGEGVRKFYFERYGKTYDDTLQHASARISQGKGDELMQDVDLLSCPKARATAYSFSSYYGDDNKFRQFGKYLVQIPVPTLIIAGSIDERQPNIPNLVTRYVDGKQIQLVVVEGAGHFFRDFNIEEAMEAAIEFVDE